MNLTCRWDEMRWGEAWRWGLIVRCRLHWLLLVPRRAFNVFLTWFWRWPTACLLSTLGSTWLLSFDWDIHPSWSTYTRLSYSFPWNSLSLDSTWFDLTESVLQLLFRHLTCLQLPLWYLLFLYNSYLSLTRTRTSTALVPAHSTLWIDFHTQHNPALHLPSFSTWHFHFHFHSQHSRWTFSSQVLSVIILFSSLHISQIRLHDTIVRT
jgi:hypothetical protein